MIRSFAIQNFGCRVNQAEAFSWADRLMKGGLHYEEDPRRSDIVLVNTCALTAGADRDVRKFVRRTVREHPDARIVLTGCYVERSPGDFGDLSQVLSVVPNRDKEAVPEKVLGFAAADVVPGENRGPQGSRRPRSNPWRSRALVKIQDGCDDRCTFCVIPSVRGKSRSVGRDEVLSRIRALVGRGYREIVLAGIHLSAYGEDRKPGGSLAALLEDIAAVPGLGRIRLSSLDPRRMDGDLVTWLAGNPKICQHFHLSLQHASGRILKKMGRLVPDGLYDRILGGLRTGSPDAALGADVIVGFPGETGGDFEELRSFLERSPLTYVHVFPYSPRQGTPAAAMVPSPAKVKKERSAVLRRLGAEKNLRFRRSLEGRGFEAVVIREGRQERGTEERAAEVLTGNAVKVSVRGMTPGAGDVARVRITRALTRMTEGEILDSLPGSRS